MKANSKSTHMRVISMSTNATLDDGGDSLVSSETEDSDTSPRTKALTALFDYSVQDSAPVTVKNTFVEMSMPRPPAWDGCFEEREVQSAPGSVLVFPPAESNAIPPWIEQDQEYSDGEEGDSEEDRETICQPDYRFAAHGPMPHIFAAPVFFQTAPVLVPVMQRAFVLAGRPMGVTLRLADALEPVLGSASLPTVGSAGHHFRKCKPCAFAWKESGCQSGASCKFCHLCDPTEKKHRRKAKLQLRRNRSAQKTAISQ